MKVKIHHEGTVILILLFLMLGAVNLLAWLFIGLRVIPIIFSAISAIFYLLVVNFFRSPHRDFDGPVTPDLVVSSVDGTVVALEETYEAEILHRRVIQLSVFMSVFNVHANWFPVNGIVEMVSHQDGRFMSAYLPKASVENERSAVLIKTHDGHQVLVRQIAGAVARRIVTYAEPGEICSIHQHMGFIKFGSRVDIYLPLDTEIFVKIGDKTTGGITPVARLKKP
ncbi:MAG: phosphatidylserine decarboxylase family protein [Muribaculaceae bacterium]|nr:phosphatidylserine decarboxylase family protein [Muribaculaceae bacterium]